MGKDEKPAVSELTASEYFRDLKANKHESTDESLNAIYANCMTLFDKYERTGQMDAIKKLYVHLKSIEREHAVVAAGVNLFVYLSDVKPLLDRADSRVIRCIDLDRYEREIPDEVIARYEKVKDLFDRFVVMFTDYTQEHSKKIARERDPILFGIFRDDATNTTIERLYFIGDWEDEYCDLTLDKLVAESRKLNGDSTQVYEVSDPVDLPALRERIKVLEEEKRKGRVSNSGGFNVVNNLMTNGVYVASSSASSSTNGPALVAVPVQAEKPVGDAETHFVAKVKLPTQPRFPGHKFWKKWIHR